jgi:hypothetical protein
MRSTVSTGRESAAGSPGDDIARLDTLGRIFGIGLILFNAKDPQQPAFEIRVRAAKHEPDMFYVNRSMRLVEDRTLLVKHRFDRSAAYRSPAALSPAFGCRSSQAAGSIGSNNSRRMIVAGVWPATVHICAPQKIDPKPDSTVETQSGRRVYDS